MSYEGAPSGEGWEGPIPIGRGTELKLEKHLGRFRGAIDRIAALSERLEVVWDQKLALLDRELSKPVDRQDHKLIALLERDLDGLEHASDRLGAVLDEIYQHQGEQLDRVEALAQERTDRLPIPQH